MRTNKRVAILIEKEDKIFLLNRKKHNKQYYILPGGGVEDNESLKEAVIREAKEELGIKVKIIEQVVQFENRGSIEHYFKCGNETGDKIKEVVGDGNLHKFIKDKGEWVSKDDIKNIKLYPQKIKFLLIRSFKKEEEDNYCLKDINFDNIKNSCVYIPELADNILVYENSIWHDNESVFDHTMNTVKALKEIIKNIKPNIKNYLSQKVNSYSRKKLLFLATLLHDIGKKDTIIQLEDRNDTNCPNHEEIGSELAIKLLKRFDLGKKEKEIVKKVIKNHGEIHLVLDGTKLNKKKLKDFKNKYSNIYWELILLGAADVTATAHTTREEGRANLLFRIKFYSDRLGIPSSFFKSNKNKN